MAAKFTAQGNLIDRAFYCERERYHYDFEACTIADGWEQWDTENDASYFGVWIHRADRLVVQFIEGDEVTVSCATDERFSAELTAMAEFYGPPPPSFTTIDNDGTITRHYAERADE